MTEPLPPGNFDSISRTSGILVGTSRTGGLDVHFPPGRNSGVLVGMIVFIFFVAGLGWVFEHILGGGSAQIQNPDAGEGRVVFAVIFGFILLMTIYVAAKIALYSQRVDVDPDGVTITNSFAGIKSSRKIPGSEVTDIKTKVGFTFGPSRIPYQTIVIARKVGDDTSYVEEIEAGSMIRDSGDAEWLVNEMKKGLKGNTT